MVGRKISNRVGRITRVGCRLADGRGDVGDQAWIEGLGNDVLGTERQHFSPIGIGQGFIDSTRASAAMADTAAIFISSLTSVA